MFEVVSVMVYISCFWGGGGGNNFSGRLRFFQEGFKIVSGGVEMFSEVSEIFSEEVGFFPRC